MRREIYAHEEDNQYTLVMKRELDGKKIIMSIWYFRIKSTPDGRLIYHKALLFPHRGMQQWGVNYWETYSPLVNWMSVRAMLTLSIPQKIHTKYVDLFLVYPQADVQSEIYTDLPLGFGVDGDHPRQWVIRLDKNQYGLKDSGLIWFKNSRKV